MLKRLDYGAVITDGFDLFRSRFSALFPFCLMFGVFFAIVQTVLTLLRYWMRDTAIVYGVLSFAISVVLSIALVYVTALVGGGLIRSLRGESDESALPTREQLGTPLPNVRDTAIRVGGILGALGAVTVLLRPISETLAVFAGLAALIFSVYFGIRWMFAGVIARVDDTNVDDAVARSEQIATGRFWHLLLLSIIVGLAAGIPTVIIMFGMVLIFGVVFGIALSNAVAGVIAGSFGGMLVYAVIGFPWVAAMLATAYQQLTGNQRAVTDPTDPTSTTGPHAGPIQPG